MIDSITDLKSIFKKLTALLFHNSADDPNINHRCNQNLCINIINDGGIIFKYFKSYEKIEPMEVLINDLPRGRAHEVSTQNPKFFDKAGAY